MPSLLPSASRTEKVMGSLPVEVALTAISAIAGGPLAALLPPLAKSLAAERQRQRVETALLAVNGILEERAEALISFSDAQYKLINESILALLHTTSEQKITYLKHAVQNVIDLKDIESQEAAVLSRIVRDISADEANFLCTNFAFERVQLSSKEIEEKIGVLNIKLGTRESLVITGLVSLGVLENAEATWDGSGMLRYSTITAKLLALLKN